MCLTESSIVAIICATLAIIGSFVTTAIIAYNRSQEKYKMKQEAILRSLKLLDTYYSFLDFSSGITPERDPSIDSFKMTEESRDCYNRLCVSVRNHELIETFLDIILGRVCNQVTAFNKFRNLSRIELNLRKMHLDNDSIFLSRVSTKALQKKDKEV